MAQYGQQGNYPPKYPQDAYSVQMPPGGGVQPMTVIETRTQPKWSWCSLITAFFGFFLYWCCCCGLVAVVAALLEYTDHKNKDFERAANKRRLAYGCGITAIVFGAIGWIAVIASYAVLFSWLASLTNQYRT